MFFNYYNSLKLYLHTRVSFHVLISSDVLFSWSGHIRTLFFQVDFIENGLEKVRTVPALFYDCIIVEPLDGGARMG